MDNNLQYWMTERDNLLDILKGLAPDGEKEEAIKYQNVQKALSTAERRIEDYEKHQKDMEAAQDRKKNDQEKHLKELEIANAKLEKIKKEAEPKAPEKKPVMDYILEGAKILVPIAAAGVWAFAAYKQEALHQRGCLELTAYEMEHGVGMMSATKAEVRRPIQMAQKVTPKM